MGYAVGIDLGTTNSVISYFHRGVAETILVDGQSALPSVIAYKSDGNVLVGQAAKVRLIIDPENAVSSAKRHIGDPKKIYQVGGKKITPTDVGALVLQKLMESARKALAEGIRDAVITVPAYFNEVQREATRKAGEAAGLNVLRLVPEPTAAAVAYGLDKGKDQTIMVYDLGGGTFDVSILEIKGNQFEVKAVGGDSHLGGDDFDQAIMDWVVGKVSRGSSIGRNASGKEALQSRQRLKEAVEKAKIELSQCDSTQIQLPNYFGKAIDLELTISEYNKIIAPLLQKTIECMRGVLRDAKMDAEDISRVILVGGSTKNRAVRDIVTREIKEPYIADRVDEVVSHGAAIIAANLFLPAEEALPIEVSDVTAHSFGINMIDGSTNQEFFKVIIPRQTKYPCRMGTIGTTQIPYQKDAQMNVYRGEERIPDKNTYLGELTLPINPPQKDIIPVGAVFELDRDGIIHFTAVVLPLGNDIMPIINNAEKNDGRLDEQTVALIDQLVKQNKAKAKSVSINTNASEQVKYEERVSYVFNSQKQPIYFGN